VWEKPRSQEFVEHYRALGFSDEVIHRADGLYCGPKVPHPELWEADGWQLKAEYPAGVDNLGVVVKHEGERWK
jgi:hypothetical protein